VKTNELFRIIKPEILIFIVYLLRYISYSFLVFPVLSSLGFFIVIASTITNGDLSFVNLSFFSFINPIFGKSSCQEPPVKCTKSQILAR